MKKLIAVLMIAFFSFIGCENDKGKSVDTKKGKISIILKTHRGVKHGKTKDVLKLMSEENNDLAIFFGFRIIFYQDGTKSRLNNSNPYFILRYKIYKYKWEPFSHLQRFYIRFFDKNDNLLEEKIFGAKIGCKLVENEFINAQSVYPIKYRYKDIYRIEITPRFQTWYKCGQKWKYDKIKLNYERSIKKIK